MNLKHALLSLAALLCFSVQLNAEEQPQPHRIGLAKLIVDDLAKTQEFYETFFGMKELTRYNYAPHIFEETIMGYNAKDAKLALFAPNDNIEKPLAKSQFPVVLIYSPELDTVVERLEAAGHTVRRLGAGSFQVGITKDPSGNTVEIFSRPSGKYEVGGSKHIVDDKAKAQAFYEAVFNAKPGQTYAAPNVYDEVLMQVGEGPFLALFQPLQEQPLTKSRFPVTAFYTYEFDTVLSQIEEQGLGYEKVDTQGLPNRIIIAKDPAGNAIEIIEANPK